MIKQNISIIIVTYNTKNITDECLRRVKVAADYCENTLKNKVETIVVDNASTDKSAEFIQKNYSWVKLIRSEKNEGFGKGNNIGLGKTHGDFILLLNSDAFLEKVTLVKSLEFFESNPDCDVLQINIRNRDGSFQLVGGNEPTPIRMLFWSLGLESVPGINKLSKPIYEHDQDDYKKVRELEWSSAAFLLMRREVYVRTGGFDERFFMYMEDVDLCKRVRDLGFTIIYNPGISIVHLSGASDKNNLNRQKLTNQLKGMLYFQKKHFKNTYLLIKPIILFGFWLRSIIYLLMGNVTNAKAYYIAVNNLI